jgi:hypothetical protein
MGASAQHWSRTVLTRVQAHAERQLDRLAASLATKHHPWRHANRLWPDMFEE